MIHDIAIITVTYNKLFASCLTSVRKILDASPLRVAFILVDNGSKKIDAHAMVKAVIPEADVILRARNHGMGRSANIAARDSEAKYYFFLNPDTDIPDHHLVKRLYDFLEAHPKVGIAAPRLIYPNGQLQATCRHFPRWYQPLADRTNLLSKQVRERHRKFFHMEDFSHERRRMVDWVQGSAFMMSAALFHEIGGFDERYALYFEDVDLCRECWQHGRPVYYLPDVTMTHAYGKASQDERGIVKSVLHNPATRYHISSWLKYLWKWRNHPHYDA